MTKIEEFLRTFEDQQLANLQAAAEDGKLEYFNTCGCLLHYKCGHYAVTKRIGAGAKLAGQAELEFYWLAFPDVIFTRSLAEDDTNRCKIMLPLIHAEWERRANERQAEVDNGVSGRRDDPSSSLLGPVDESMAAETSPAL